MEHIKITDLCVGDWVMYDLKPYIVQQIDGESEHVVISGSEGVREKHIDYIEPICIKPEILKMNGFVNIEDIWTIESDSKSLTHYPERRLFICINKRTRATLSLRGLYLHQLQHALRLAGIDKEIEL